MTATAIRTATVQPIAWTTVDVRADRSDAVALESTAHPAFHYKTCQEAAMENEQIGFECVNAFEWSGRLVEPGKHAFIGKTCDLQLDISGEHAYVFHYFDDMTYFVRLNFNRCVNVENELMLFERFLCYLDIYIFN